MIGVSLFKYPECKKHLLCMLIVLISWNFTSGQGFFIPDENYDYTLSHLQKLVEQEQDSIISTLSHSEKILARSIQVKVQNSTNLRLISSSYIDFKREVNISNSFLITLAKITDAFVIEQSIEGEFPSAKYLYYCAENSDDELLGPTVYFRMDADKVKNIYLTKDNYTLRYVMFKRVIRFILLHEFAHHINGDLDGSKISKIQREIKADQFAIDVMESTGWSPIITTHLMIYFYFLDSFNSGGESTSLHPTGIERLSPIFSSGLSNLHRHYQVPASVKKHLIPYPEMFKLMHDLGLSLYPELLLAMNEDYDTYLEQAEDGNTTAQIKMGVMHFKGVDGWEKNKPLGFKWLKKSAENSELAALLLGMFHEYNLELDLAVNAYRKSMEKGNYYAKELYVNLEQWNRNVPNLYEHQLRFYLKKTREYCIHSCLSSSNSSQKECENQICNYYVDEMHYELFDFRRHFSKLLKKRSENTLK